jgi:hypothetical protein
MDKKTRERIVSLASRIKKAQYQDVQQIMQQQPTGIQAKDALLQSGLNLARQLVGDVVSTAETAVNQDGKNIGIVLEMDPMATTGGVAEVQTVQDPNSGTQVTQRRIGVNLNGIHAKELRDTLADPQYGNVDATTAELITSAYVIAHELKHHTTGKDLLSEAQTVIDPNDFIQRAKAILGVR